LAPASQQESQGAEALGFLDLKGFESPYEAMSGLPIEVDDGDSPGL
jgi:hypothetical protein